MSQWRWLNESAPPYGWAFAARVVFKAALLFVVVNVVFALVDPLPALGQISVYNILVPGRERLPYGENSAQSYSLSLYDLNALFASQALARPKAADEFRVLVLGDSATWGFLLRPEDTLVGKLNAMQITSDDGRRMHFYNLGYPEMSLMKDVLLLDHAMQYEPDFILWAVTLESFSPERQTAPRLVQYNSARVRQLIDQYDLSIASQERLIEPSFFDRTLVGRRRELADWLRLQLYGFAWAATSIDQHYPESFTLRSSDLEADTTWAGLTEAEGIDAESVTFDTLAAGVERAGSTPVLIVNEPMFISSGENSDLRYNFFYPRWAYDRYRTLLTELAQERGWQLFDVWDRIAPDEFTDSPVHMTPEGSAQFAEIVKANLLELT